MLRIAGNRLILQLPCLLHNFGKLTAVDSVGKDLASVHSLSGFHGFHARKLHAQVLINVQFEQQSGIDQHWPHNLDRVAMNFQHHRQCVLQSMLAGATSRSLSLVDNTAASHLHRDHCHLLVGEDLAISGQSKHTHHHGNARENDGRDSNCRDSVDHKRSQKVALKQQLWHILQQYNAPQTFGVEPFQLAFTESHVEYLQLKNVAVHQSHGRKRAATQNAHQVQLV
mmetsp:Transcript_33195/g.54017  ORF Transcript_33195/g.54017 Transcript_33195/m.54017 type:complete len:226 (+) Transcript_33195:297-974(+)